MHDEIKRFSLNGELGDANVVEAKARLVLFLESQMRDSGHVPSLDLEPQFTRVFNPETETWDFELSVYGIHVGKESECQTAGVMAGKTIMKSTPLAR